MPNLLDKANPASLFLVEMTFSGPQELMCLGYSSRHTVPQFVSLVSEGLKAEPQQMVHSVAPLRGKVLSHGPQDRPWLLGACPRCRPATHITTSHGQASLGKLRDKLSWSEQMSFYHQKCSAKTRGQAVGGTHSPPRCGCRAGLRRASHQLRRGLEGAAEHSGEACGLQASHS